MSICGREFSETDLSWIREQVAEQPHLTRVQLSRRFCAHTDWRKPDGGLKEMSCRVALLRLERQGLVQLPAPRHRLARVGQILRTPQGDPQPALEIEPAKAVKRSAASRTRPALRCQSPTLR